jgi:hypothetical protein
MAALSENGRVEIDGMPPLNWAAAWRPKSVGPCGDRHLVRRLGPLFMLAVIDGAGSGARAAEAAAASHAALTALDGPTTLEGCFAAVHRACQGTAGVAMAVLLLDPAAASLAWGAVGDIDAQLIRAAPTERNECILQSGGTLGVRLPAVLGQSHRIRRGDTMLLVSDGIRRGYAEASKGGVPVTAIAQAVLRDHARPADDAIVLAARLGPPS